MTLITVQGGAVVMLDGAVGTGQDCCRECCAECILWSCGLSVAFQDKSVRVTYKGQTLALGDFVTVVGAGTGEFESWLFACIGAFGNSNVYFEYEKSTANCEEKFVETFVFSCAGSPGSPDSKAQWTVDVYRSYQAREDCFDNTAPLCEQYWFDIPIAVNTKCRPEGDIVVTASPDQEDDPGGNGCGGATLGTLTLSYV